MGKEKRMIGDYTVLSSVNVGEKEIIISGAYLRLVTKIPTMKPADSEGRPTAGAAQEPAKGSSGAETACAETVVPAPAAEKIDFSNVEIEP